MLRIRLKRNTYTALHSQNSQKPRKSALFPISLGFEKIEEFIFIVYRVLGVFLILGMEIIRSNWFFCAQFFCRISLILLLIPLGPRGTIDGNGEFWENHNFVP